jgi:hypothetical protein
MKDDERDTTMNQKPTAVLTRHDGTAGPLDVELGGRDPRTWGVSGTQQVLQYAILLAMGQPTVSIEVDRDGVTFIVGVGGNVLRVGPIAGVNADHAREAAENPTGFVQRALRAANAASLPR